MKRFLGLVLLFSAAIPAFAKTHKDAYPVPCGTLWGAIKDTIKNSGKYIVVSLDDNNMLASYSMGSVWTSKRINSVSLNPQGTGCEMQTQTSFSGLVNNDASDFKKRVEEALAKQQGK